MNNDSRTEKVTAMCGNEWMFVYTHFTHFFALDQEIRDYSIDVFRIVLFAGRRYF